MESEALLKYAGTENLLGNLIEMFEGKLVFIGDISTGVSDLGQTPLASMNRSFLFMPLSKWNAHQHLLR